MALPLALDELRALALSPKLVWRHFAPGVQIHRLWGAPHTRSGALLRYAPGSKVPRHRHEGTEKIYVLIGKQRDERGDLSGGHARRQSTGIDPLRLEPGGLRRLRGVGTPEHLPRRHGLT